MNYSFQSGYKNITRKQSGITYPSARKQDHLLIIRLDIARPRIEDTKAVREGLKRLCTFFDILRKGVRKIDELTDNGKMERSNMSKFHYTATIGFGVGFFEKLNIAEKNRPKKLKEMPDHTFLGDPTPYDLGQTDMIIQIGSTNDFVNRWVLENSLQPFVEESHSDQYIGGTGKTYATQLERYGNEKETPDIVSALRGWAIITDVHAGFQRIDGRNLMGFNDGVSNPDGVLRDQVVWLNSEEESEKLHDGTYMVFQKIEHDLDQWRGLAVEEQERWVGRSKGTGLLLGTLSIEEDRKMALDLQSDDATIRNSAITKLKDLLTEQRDPEKRFYDSKDLRYSNIQAQCPVWSHVRKANPRQADNVPKKLIFRRGYLYMDKAINGKYSSGLLFICFQKDIANSFEYIKRNFLNNKNFPVPEIRKNYNKAEETQRRQRGLFNEEDIRRLTSKLGYSFDREAYMRSKEESKDRDSQNTGREGLAGSSQLGAYPRGQFLASIPLGGGYYFIPPMPNSDAVSIGEQFFE